MSERNPQRPPMARYASLLVLALLEGIGDADGGGVPNFLDDDSNGNGISDAVEAGPDPSGGQRRQRHLGFSGPAAALPAHRAPQRLNYSANPRSA